MSRAEKSVYLKFDYKAAYEAARVTLDQDTQDLLAKELGIEKDKNLIKDMTAQVEKVLTSHKVESKNPNKPPSVASQVRVLESLHKSISTLLKDFEALQNDYNTWQNLYLVKNLSLSEIFSKSPDGFQNEIEALKKDLETWKALYPLNGTQYPKKLIDLGFRYLTPVTEWESDKKALITFERRVRLALRNLEIRKKQGRPKDYILITTVWWLSMLFDRYNQSSKKKPKRRHDFIAKVLSVDDIPRTDFESGKFYNLLKNHFPLHSNIGQPEISLNELSKALSPVLNLLNLQNTLQSIFQSLK